MKKKISRHCLLLVCFLFMTSMTLQVCASQGQVAYVAEKTPVIKVAVPDEESIVVERMVYDMLKRTGYEMVAKPSGMRTAVDEILRGDADMLTAQVAWLESKYPELVRIPVSHTTVSFDVYARDNAIWQIGKWDDMSGLRVVSRWQNLYIAESIPDGVAENIKVSEYQELWDVLINGDADICVMSNPEHAERIAPKGLKRIASLDVQPVYTYIDRAHIDKLPIFIKALEDMKKDGTIDKIKGNEFGGTDKIVLHISSYSSDMLWEREMIDGIRQGLDPDGVDGSIVYYNFNLNARHTENMDNQRLSLARVIRGAFMERAPDIVIVSDNEALAFVEENHFNIFRDTPVVFCGINDFAQEMIYNISNYAAGCTEVLSASATVQEMLSLFPDTKNIYVINDYTTIGDKAKQDIAFQISKINTGVNIIYNDDTSFEQMIRKIESFDTDTLLLLGAYFRDANNRYLSEADLQKALHQASKMPVFTILSTGIGEGGFGGLVSSARNQGVMGGSMAKQILDGKSVDSMPIIYAGESMNQWIFDESIAREFSVRSKDLPEGYSLINPKEDPWSAKPAEIALATFLLLLLVFIIIRLSLLLEKERKQSAIRVEASIAEYSIRNISTPSKSTAEQIEGILQNIPIGFIIAVEGVITEVNRYCKKEFGLLQGGEIRDIYKNPMIHEKILAELDVQEFIGGEVLALVMSDKSVRRHYMSFGRVEHEGKMGYMLFAIDVEELEHQKDYSRRSQDDLQKIIDALPSAMAIVGTSTCELEYANNEFLQVYGYTTMEEAQNFDFQSIIEQVFAQWQGSTVVFEYDSSFAREHGIHLKMFADQIVFRNKNCFVLIGQDISVEMKNAEMLMRAAEKEKEANMLKGVFLANMSHEIRTPMNAIIGLAQLALMREQSDENSEFFSKISSSARNLLSIINDILDFSKIEAEKMDFVEEEFSLEETITNAFLVAAERIEDKKLEILLDMDQQVPCYLYGDKIRLWQILKNILDNAVKYTREGRVVLKIEYCGADEEHVIVSFRVSDTGMGMSPEQLEKLFMPFEQFHRNSTKKAGTGLGLSITKQLVELMNGEIHVESVAEQGTDFYVTIPFRPAQNRITIGEFARQSVSGGIDHMHTVLIVDQDEYACRIMSDILRHAGIDSVRASNSEEARQMAAVYAERGEPFQTAILNYTLEETDGIETAQRIDPDGEMTKLLLMTAHAKKNISDKEIRESGIKDTIEKPFIISAFLQKVCGVIPEKLQMTKEKRPDYTGSRILLCEDNEINQEVAQGILESFHITTVIAENGQVGIELLEKETFDLVLMDISMPVMDGHEATIKIRQSGAHYKDIPIVAMTANVMQDEVEQCLREGMNEHVEKPIDLVKFQKMLAHFLTPCSST